MISSYNQLTQILRSRSSLDASVDFLGYKFESAAIPANMKCTIDFKKAKELSEAGYFMYCIDSMNMMIS